MAYIDSLLASGERPIKREHQHWFILVANAAYGILALVAAILLLFISGNLGQGFVKDVLGWVIVIIVVGGLGYLAWESLRWTNREFVVTTRRVLQMEGVINKRVMRQLAREDQRRDPDAVAVRPDVRLRRPRDPDRVRERHLAAPDAPRRRRLQAGDARGEARAGAGAVGQPADAVAAAAGRAAGSAVRARAAGRARRTAAGHVTGPGRCRRRERRRRPPPRPRLPAR